MARGCDRRHHAIGADDDEAIYVLQRNFHGSERAVGVGVHRLDHVTGERAIARPVGLESRGLVTAPNDDVGRSLDLFRLVSVGALLVAGKVDDAVAARALPGQSKTTRRCRGRRRPDTVSVPME